jgi:hypothetical protein
MAGVLVTGMQTSRKSPQEEEETNSTGLRAKPAVMPSIPKPSSSSAVLSQLTEISACVCVCVCVCVGSRAQTVDAVVPCGLSASLKVEDAALGMAGAGADALRRVLSRTFVRGRRR